MLSLLKYLFVIYDFYNDFCFSSFLHSQTTWWEEFLGEANVWAAFGCHPHYARFFGEEEEDHLRLALLNPKVVALGEIGLDYSNR